MNANPTTVGTVPSGQTWLLKTLAGWNTDSSARDISLYVTSYTNPSYGIRSLSIPAGAALLLPLWLVFEAGDVIKFDPSVLNKVRLTGYGAKLAA